MRWSENDDEVLRKLAGDGRSAPDIAKIMMVSTSSVTNRARRLKVRFISVAARPLRRFITQGGTLLREDLGGALGVRWTTATRTGANFPVALCERLLEQGELIPGYDSAGTYRCAHAPNFDHGRAAA